MAIATYTLAVGQYCDGVLSQVGITMSQASVRQVNNAIALRLLAQGFHADYVLKALLDNDRFNAFRQIGVIDRNGHAACHTGGGARDWKGHRIRPGLIAMGNVLLGPQVVDAMVEGYEADPEAPFEERLLRGLEMGCDAGGQSNGQRRMPERSAALVIFAKQDHPEVNLRVDLHDHAVDELRRIHTRYLAYADYYRRRDLDPANTPGQEVFERGFGGETFSDP
jgi:uncharacterized Ntn-hydrolase superfamily protein